MKKKRKLNRKKIKELFILLVLTIIIVLLSQCLKNALSRYQSDMKSNLNDLNVAFCVLQNDFQSKNVLLDNIYPSPTPFEFPISISNYQETMINNETNEIEDSISEVSFELDIILKATTNLPLNFKIYDGEDELSITEKIEKENGVYIKTVTANYASNQEKLLLQHGSKILKTFTLKVEFPVKTDMIINNVLVTDSVIDEKYSDLIDNVNISVVSRQKK